MKGLKLTINRSIINPQPLNLKIIHPQSTTLNSDTIKSETHLNSTTELRYLAKINSHERDRKITFEEEGHKYTIEGLNKDPISVTTLIHHNFPTFDADLVISKMVKSRNWINSKYYGKTPEEIKDEWKKSGEVASHLGTLMHADIERFLNKEDVLSPNTIEFSYFKSFWEEFQKTHPGFYPYRTEWLVYDEINGIAGSIDCVLTNTSGQLIILDWKRSKEIKLSNTYEKGLGPFCHLDHCNFWHYSLQLNIYRHILETKYNKEILEMHIVVLHPDNDTYKMYTISPYDIASIWDILSNKNYIKSH